MAKVIIETATFTPTITVPEGTDTRSHAAEDVEAIAQGLANRTQAIKAVTDNAARRDEVNTFALANTFNGQVTANAGIRAADGTVEMLGALSVAGALHPDGGLSASGGVNVASTLNVNAGCWVNAPHLFLLDNVDIVHSSSAPNVQPTRQVQLDISQAMLLTGNPDYTWQEGFWLNLFDVNSARLGIPFTLPRGTEQWSFDVIWSADDPGEPNTAEAWIWPRDYGVLGVYSPPTAFSLGSVTQTSFDAGPNNAFIDSGPVVVWENSPPDHRMGIIVTLGNGHNNKLWGVRLKFWDPGPRNG
jgi:hypothetical protein